MMKAFTIFCFGVFLILSLLQSVEGKNCPEGQHRVGIGHCTPKKDSDMQSMPREIVIDINSQEWWTRCCRRIRLENNLTALCRWPNNINFRQSLCFILFNFYYLISLLYFFIWISLSCIDVSNINKTWLSAFLTFRWPLLK